MHTRFSRNVTRLLQLITLVLFVGALDLQAETAPRYRRVRAMHGVVGELLWRGYRESITFRTFVNALERSDVIVHLELGAKEQSGHAGTTQFAARRGGQRYLRIVVADSRRPQSTSIAVLGHELFHALEVAQTPWVTDSATYKTLYQKIGYPSCEAPVAGCYETKQAAEAGLQVLAEVNGRSFGQRVGTPAPALLTAFIR